VKRLKMTAWLAAFMSIVLVFTGCGPKRQSQPARIKVALVLDVVGRGDGGFNDAAIVLMRE